MSRVLTRPAALALAAAAAVGFASSAARSATVVYSNTFTADAVGTAPAGFAASGAGLTLTTVDDANALSPGGNNALGATFTAGRNATTPFGATTTLADGDRITLDFDVRIASTPLVGDRQFRFELYNSTDLTGYTGRLDTGADATGNTFDLFLSKTSALNATTANGSVSLARGTDAGGQLADSLARHVTMTLTRAGGTMQTSLAVDTAAGEPATIVGTATTGNGPAFAFNSFVFGINTVGAGNSEELRLDNLNVVFTPASELPEPASLATIALVAIAARRRR